MLRRYLFENKSLGVCITGCVLFTISCVLSCDINADVFVMMNTYYEGDKFWSQSGLDMGSCAKTCMRLTKCESFNYDITTRDCDMNSDLLEDTPHLGRSKKRSVYSRVKDWPKQLDSTCFHRPCKKDEICVPNKSVHVDMGSEQCIVVRGTKTDLPDKSPAATKDRAKAAKESASSDLGICHKVASVMTTMTGATKWKSAASSPTESTKEKSSASSPAESTKGKSLTSPPTESTKGKSSASSPTESTKGKSSASSPTESTKRKSPTFSPTAQAE